MELTKEQLIEGLRDAHQRLLELEGRVRESSDDTQWLEEAIKKRTRELNERVKELNCLYQISSVLDEPNRAIPETIQKLADTVPQAWQHPKLSCARIVLGGREYRTGNFVETPWRQSCDIIVRRQNLGIFEVGYVSSPPAATPIFLPEEQRLLEEICRRLGRLLELLNFQA